MPFSDAYLYMDWAAAAAAAEPERVQHLLPLLLLRATWSQNFAAVSLLLRATWSQNFAAVLLLLRRVALHHANLRRRHLSAAGVSRRDAGGSCIADGSAERSARSAAKVSQPQELAPGLRHLG